MILLFDGKFLLSCDFIFVRNNYAKLDCLIAVLNSDFRKSYGNHWLSYTSDFIWLLGKNNFDRSGVCR